MKTILFIFIVQFFGVSIFGQPAYQHLITTRPDLAEILEVEKKIDAWLKNEIDKENYFWDNIEPKSGRFAEHEYTGDDHNTIIFRVSSDLSSADQLAGIVFELFNAQRKKQFDRIFDKAINGKIDKRQFAKALISEEYIAVKNARTFLDKNLLRYYPKANKVLYPLLNTPETLDEHLEFYQLKGIDLMEHHYELFESEIVPLRKQ